MRWVNGCVVLAMLMLAGSMGCGHSGDSGKEQTAQSRAAPDADAGRVIYARGCLNCHGPNAQGLVHQGTNLRTSQFMARTSDADLIAFLRKGRPAKDPTNHSGIAMPGGGTIPGFGDDAQGDTDTLADVVAYLRQIQGVKK